MTLMLTVKEVAAALNIGRDAAYELCHRPDFPVVSIGRQLRVPRKGLEAWIERQSTRLGANQAVTPEDAR